MSQVLKVNGTGCADGFELLVHLVASEDYLDYEIIPKESLGPSGPKCAITIVTPKRRIRMLRKKNAI